MARKTIELDRVAGEAELVLVHDGDKVVEAYFLSRAPVRGFERLVVGKNPLFVLEAVMRICGVCHAAHAIAAAEALEDALGVSVPAAGRVLREVIGLVNRVQSHLFHLVLLVPDFVGSSSGAERLIVETVKLLNAANEIMMRVGGAPTHPPNITVGGAARQLTEAGRSECLKICRELLKRYRGLAESLLAGEGRVHELRKFPAPSVDLMASHVFYGDKFCVDTSRVKVVKYSEYRGVNLDTTSLVALYGGKPVEVGPRARLTLYRGFRALSLYDVQLARMEEVELSLMRVIELLERLDTTSPARSSVVLRRGRGIGVYEAPRGTLLHQVELDEEGRVVRYKVVVPTMFNAPVVEKAATGLPVDLADLAPRLYDPCIPCATHFIRVESWVR